MLPVRTETAQPQEQRGHKKQKCPRHRHVSGQRTGSRKGCKQERSAHPAASDNMMAVIQQARTAREADQVPCCFQPQRRLDLGVLWSLLMCALTPRAVTSSGTPKTSK